MFSSIKRVLSTTCSFPDFGNAFLNTSCPKRKKLKSCILLLRLRIESKTTMKTTTTTTTLATATTATTINHKSDLFHSEKKRRYFCCHSERRRGKKIQFPGKSNYSPRSWHYRRSLRVRWREREGERARKRERERERERESLIWRFMSLSFCRSAVIKNCDSVKKNLVDKIFGRQS